MHVNCSDEQVFQQLYCWFIKNLSMMFIADKRKVLVNNPNELGTIPSAVLLSMIKSSINRQIFLPLNNRNLTKLLRSNHIPFLNSRKIL